jgi:hypothetical protein
MEFVGLLRATVRLEGCGKLKIPVMQWGVEPTTFWLVAWRLNQPLICEWEFYSFDWFRYSQPVSRIQGVQF